MYSTQLRDLFSEFPEMPEDILVQARDDSSLRNGIRYKDQYVVVHEVDHEFSARPVPKSGTPLEECLLHYMGDDPDAKLFYNGKPVLYEIVRTLKLL